MYHRRSPNKHSPILITVYNRTDHFRKSIESLQNCYLAKDTDLYIASDAPLIEDHRDSVLEVRRIAKSIDGFKSVTLIEQRENVGALKNYYSSIEFVFGKHDSLIFLQDDVVVGKGFLLFMNDGLLKFRDNYSIVGICGYIPPCASHLETRPFFLKRRSPYGLGIWRHKEFEFEKTLGKTIAKEILSSYKKFVNVAHVSPHIISTMPFIASGDFRAGDYEAAAAMAVTNKFSLYPPLSLVTNIGVDGSGLHSGSIIELQNQAYSNEVVSIPESIELKESSKVSRSITRYWSFPQQRLVHNIVYFGWNYLPGFYFALKALKLFRKAIR